MLYEYQVKNILSSYGLLVPEGRFIESKDKQNILLEVTSFFEKGSKKFVLKAQVPFGNRASLGGIKVLETKEEILDIASKMLNDFSEENIKSKRSEIYSYSQLKGFYVEEYLEYESEYYISFVVDFSMSSIFLIVATEGGTGVENTLLNEDSEGFLKIKIDRVLGLCDFECNRVASFIKLERERYEKLRFFLKSLWKMFIDMDAILLEINPLVFSKQKESWCCLDAKMILDDNAFYRQVELLKNQEQHKELSSSIAKKKNKLNYVQVDGNVGCIVNGAGLAMATMDMVDIGRFKAANFLDIGGSADIERIEKGINIILSNDSLEVIFINIFGGILRCDLVSEGLISSAKSFLHRNIKIIARLDGNNSDVAKQMLTDSAISDKVIFADSFAKALEVLNSLK